MLSVFHAPGALRASVLILSLLAVACARIEAPQAGGGNADGFQGGDPLYAKVATATRTASLAFQSMVRATSRDSRVCTFADCDPTKLYCQALSGLNEVQTSQCRALLYDAAPSFIAMLSSMPGTAPVAFRLVHGPLTDPASGGVVAAVTTNARNSEVFLDRQAVERMSVDELIILVVHELGHKYGGPSFIKDNMPHIHFRTGRASLDAAGAAIAAYVRDVLALDINGSVSTVNTNLDPVFLTLPNGDLMKVIRSQTRSGFVEVEIASSITAYGEVYLRSVLPYELRSAAVCDYTLKGADLVCVLTANTGSNEVEFHGLSAESRYTMFNMRLAINHGLTAGENLEFKFAATEVYMIKRAPTGSGKIEIHPLSASSSYRQYTAHWATDIDESESLDVEFVSVGNDLLSVRRIGVNSGTVEVAVRNRVTSFVPQSSHVLPFSVGGLRGSFAWAGVNRDLMVLKTKNTPSNSIEVDILSSVSGFQSFLQRLRSGFRLPLGS